MDVIVTCYHNNAVWNALKLHIGYMLELNVSIRLIIVSKYPIDIKAVKDEFSSSVSVLVCKGRSSLFLILLRSRSSTIFAITVLDVVLSLGIKMLRKQDIIFWVQGIIPEEDFLSRKSHIRFNLFSIMEKISLKYSTKQVFVSTEMKAHFIRKYKRDFPNSTIVSCVSDIKYTGAKKEKDTFVYIGGVSKWQRIDLILDIFNRICDFRPESKLYIATFARLEAEQLIERFSDPRWKENIQTLTVNNRVEAASLLSKVQYGFLIRDDIDVNHVASPIKFAEYLSCGVHPIISSSVRSYAPLVLQYKCGIVINGNDLNPDDLNREFVIELPLRLSQDSFSVSKQIAQYRELINN